MLGTFPARHLALIRPSFRTGSSVGNATSLALLRHSFHSLAFDGLGNAPQDFPSLSACMYVCAARLCACACVCACAHICVLSSVVQGVKVTECACILWCSCRTCQSQSDLGLSTTHTHTHTLPRAPHTHTHSYTHTHTLPRAPHTHTHTRFDR